MSGTLNEIHLALQPLAGVQLHECGKASFVSAEHHGRFIEIFESNSGKWWLEFWEASEDPDAAPSSEAHAADMDAALKLAKRLVAAFSSLTLLAIAIELSPLTLTLSRSTGARE